MVPYLRLPYPWVPPMPYSGELSTSIKVKMRATLYVVYARMYGYTHGRDPCYVCRTIYNVRLRGGA